MSQARRSNDTRLAKPAQIAAGARSHSWIAEVEADHPIQYDELRIEHDQGDVEIVVYHRAVLLFTTDSEAVRQSHQVCWRVDDIAVRHGRM